MRFIIATLAILAGITAGVYFGGYDMLYLGIIHIVNAIQAKPIKGGTLAGGIVQVFFLWELIFALCVWVGIGVVLGSQAMNR